MSSLDEGLGPVAARLPSRARREEAALALVRSHLDSAPRGYVAWSGGKDSTACVHLVRRVNPDVPVVWFDSGLEFPETPAYLRELADLWGLNFHVIRAVPDALTLLAASGAWEHGLDWEKLRGGPGVGMHEALVSGPARQAHDRFGAGEVIGLRAGESVGRRILLASGRGRYERTDGSMVTAPIWRWSGVDVEAYLAAHGIPENPVYRKLRALGAPEHAQRVGLLVDGNAAEVGRFTWLRVGWPEVWRDLVAVLPRLSEWR